MIITNSLLKCSITVTPQYGDISCTCIIHVTLRREVGPVLSLLLALCSVYGTQGNGKGLQAMLRYMYVLRRVVSVFSADGTALLICGTQHSVRALEMVLLCTCVAMELPSHCIVTNTCRLVLFRDGPNRERSLFLLLH
jgi:hypothetical protein